MSKRGFSVVEFLIVIAIIAMMAAIAVPAIVKAREQSKAVECDDMPPGYKLQKKGDEWRVAATTFDWQSRPRDSRESAVDLAKYLARYDGWNEEDCDWRDEKPEVEKLAKKITGTYDIYSNGRCYFWYDGGMGISARRFKSCEEAVCGAQEYFRMLRECDAAGLKRVLTDGMNFPWRSEYGDYKKVKSGLIAEDDCGC